MKNKISKKKRMYSWMNPKQYWSMTEGVFNCLIDHKRTLAFEKAIKNTVRPGDIVVDMGSGTGVLAMFAADAGAKRIYAIEYDQKNILTLQNNFNLNGYQDKILIIRGDATKIRLPEKTDVIIGEMIATGLIEELQIPAMNNMLRFANKGARVVLSKFKNFIDLVNSNNIFYNHKFKIVQYEYAGDTDLNVSALSNKLEYACVDFSKINKDSLIDIKLKIPVKKTGILNGLRISSKTLFADGSSFDYSFAYSYPIILPVNETPVKNGDIILVNLSYIMCKGFNNLKYKIIKK
jgi:predicted RNA methylase